MVCNPVITALWLNSGLFILHQQENREQLAKQFCLCCPLSLTDSASLALSCGACFCLTLAAPSRFVKLSLEKKKSNLTKLIKTNPQWKMNICAHHWHVLIRPNRSQSVCKKKQEHLSIMCVCIILKKKNFSRWVEVFHLVLFIALNGKREFIWKINIFLPSCLFYTSNIIITNASCIGNVELIYLKEFLQMTLLLIWRKITTLYTEV